MDDLRTAERRASTRTDERLNGNFLTNILLPLSLAALFVGGAIYAILKFFRLF